MSHSSLSSSLPQRLVCSFSACRFENGHSLQHVCVGTIVETTTGVSTSCMIPERRRGRWELLQEVQHQAHDNPQKPSKSAGGSDHDADPAGPRTLAMYTGTSPNAASSTNVLHPKSSHMTSLETRSAAFGVVVSKPPTGTQELATTNTKSAWFQRCAWLADHSTKNSSCSVSAVIPQRVRARSNLITPLLKVDCFEEVPHVMLAAPNVPGKFPDFQQVRPDSC